MKILHKTTVSNPLPFAMNFATEPAFISLPTSTLRETLKYNPAKQINEESEHSRIMGGQTSTSLKRSTTSAPGWQVFPSTDDDDSKGDESH